MLDGILLDESSTGPEFPTATPPLSICGTTGAPVLVAPSALNGSPVLAAVSCILVAAELVVVLLAGVAVAVVVAVVVGGMTGELTAIVGTVNLVVLAVVLLAR
jgi:hypothetical protein